MDFNLIIALLTVISIVMSFYALWATLLHQGTIKMTRPAIIAFAFEGRQPKIFLRTLLRSTSKQGNVVESLHLKVLVAGAAQSFTVWAYGDNGIVRGSGLFIGELGVDVYHHFILPRSEEFKFVPGRYDIQVYGTIKNKKVCLSKFAVDLSKESLGILEQTVLGVFFDWNPVKEMYEEYVETPGPQHAARLLLV